MSQDFGSGLLAPIDYTSNRLRWSRVSHFFHADRLRQPSKRGSPGFSDCWKSWHCPVSKGMHRHLSVPPPSLDLFAWLPRPVRSAPPAPGCPLGPVAPCFQTGAASDGSRPASTSSSGHASPTARPSSRAAARSSSATSCRCSSVAPAATTAPQSGSADNAPSSWRSGSAPLRAGATTQTAPPPRSRNVVPGRGDLCIYIHIGYLAHRASDQMSENKAGKPCQDPSVMSAKNAALDRGVSGL